MTRRRACFTLPFLALGAAVVGALVPTAALAAVDRIDAGGFVIRHAARVPTGVIETWEALVGIGDWWSSAHTYSGSAANLSLDPRPGGCFCETLPNAVAPDAAPRGGVEHMRVIYVERERALRMSGALGPLQNEAANGTLTFELKPGEGGTEIAVEYVIGGYMRAAPAQLAPAFDRVLAEQVSRLAGRLGGKLMPVAARVSRPAAPAGAVEGSPADATPGSPGR